MRDGPGGACLRALTSADLDAVLAIEEACQITPWRPAFFRECLRGGDQCLVAVIDGELVGFMVLSHVLDECHLMNIAVAPAWQRRGLARWMLRTAVADARRRDMSYILLEVRVGNRGAQRLYRELGFVEYARRKEYYDARDNGWEDAVLMQLLIEPDAQR